MESLPDVSSDCLAPSQGDSLLSEATWLLVLALYLMTDTRVVFLSNSRSNSGIVNLPKGQAIVFSSNCRTLAITISLCPLSCNLPEANLEYWRERRELLSLEIAVGMSGWDTVLSRLPLVRPHRSQRDLRSPSTTSQELNN